MGVVMRKYLALAMLAGILGSSGTSAQQVDVGSGSVVETVLNLRPGEYVWAPEIAPQGPTLLIVNLKTQRTVLFRNGVPIAASTVSTGRPGYSTPTGVFTILQKRVEHYSSTYDNAPMPHMQRLTWRGIALHAGQLPGYPASHGCIRLPPGFAKLLYGVTTLGMTVVITNEPVTPRIASPPLVSEGGTIETVPAGMFEWSPEKSLTGPISILVSATDRRAIVLRNGIVIGSAPVTVSGPVTGTWAYALREIDAQGKQHWIRQSLSNEAASNQAVPSQEWQRFRAPESFRRAIAAIVEPGTTIVVTGDSLEAAASGTSVVVLEDRGSEGSSPVN
jgi:lipoprotein-anchoring transpeptidase ErfK/SrfK